MRTHARQEQPRGRRESTHTGDRVGLGGAHDEPHPRRMRGRDDVTHDALVEGTPDGQSCILHTFGLGVRRAREDEQVEPRPGEEGLEGADAEVGAHGERAGPERARRRGVGRVRRADVAPLRVEETRDLPRDAAHDLLEGRDPRGPEGLEERRVRLERRGPGMGRLDHAHRLGDERRSARHAWVEPDAHVGSDVARAPRGSLEEAHAGLPSTAAKSAMRTYMPFSTWRK